MAVRFAGDREGWVKLFLRGIIEVSQESTESARSIDALRVDKTAAIDSLDGIAVSNARKLLDQLFMTPTMMRVKVAEVLGVSASTAGALIRRFEEELGILVDVTPEVQRGKSYTFKEYMDILEVGTD